MQSITRVLIDVGPADRDCVLRCGVAGAALWTEAAEESVKR